MKGLGDVVAKVTESTGIAAAVKAVVGDDCGCAARRDALNRIFPFNKPEDGKNSSVDTQRGKRS
jgi:hypothetical protein